MMRRVLACLLLTLLVMSAATPKVFAHVLIRDDTVNIGAVLHINPDDDPIAGKNSELFYDIQDANSQVRIPYSGYELLVTDEAGQSKTVPTTAHGSNVVAEYTFPTQGLYKLELKTLPKYNVFQKVSLRYSLRVERGVAGQDVAKTYSWTSPLVTASVGASALLVVVFLNNRRRIARQSTW